MSKAWARLGDELADPAEADHAERLAVELVAAEPRARPFAVGERARGPGERSGTAPAPARACARRRRPSSTRERWRRRSRAWWRPRCRRCRRRCRRGRSRAGASPCAISSAVIFVAERIRIASNSPIRLSSSPSGQSVPTSTSKRSRSSSTPASAIFSLTRTLASRSGLSRLGRDARPDQPTGAGEPASAKTRWAAGDAGTGLDVVAEVAQRRLERASARSRCRRRRSSRSARSGRSSP